MKTKTCKYCQSEIPKKAKVCPVCRKKQSGLLTCIAVAFIIMIILTPALVKNSDNQKEDEQLENSVFTVGDSTEYRDIKVSLINITESNGIEYIKPDDGKVYVIAEFEFSNNSDTDLTLSSLMCFNAYQDGYTINSNLSALMVDDKYNSLDGTIAPGKKLRGYIGYEVPEDYSKLEIDVKLNVWSDKNIHFIYSKDK